MLRTIQFIVGFLILLAAEVLHVYFIMPFPGSQEDTTIDMAYFLHNNLIYIRVIGFLIVLFPTIYFYSQKKWLPRVLVTLCLGLYGFVFYKTNFVIVADKIFKQPGVLAFSGSEESTIKPDQLVLGVEINGKSKAYPVQLIGYHHQVRDTLNGKELMITYCTVCRTGRVFSPMVNGKLETFRLVGMDHFNAMFEDSTTQTWWRQVNGEAIVGPLKGAALREIPSAQMSLRAWLEQYPETKIMQPDTTFNERYENLKDYDRGKSDSDLLKKDSLSWQKKSWIVGVQIGMNARAYDWEELLKRRVVNDTLNKTPILVTLENDSLSFHVWNRDTLSFDLSPDSLLVDNQTKSVWNWNGRAVSGPLAGSKLPVIQSYQEFWHSWKTFRPQTTRYESKN